MSMRWLDALKSTCEDTCGLVTERTTLGRSGNFGAPTGGY